MMNLSCHLQTYCVIKYDAVASCGMPLVVVACQNNGEATQSDGMTDMDSGREGTRLRAIQD